MINWFDLMRQAQGGAAMENFARQFGLSPEQTNAAMAALMPAFAMGFQRAAMNPMAMTQLFQAMSGGHFPAFWESAAQAFTPQARQEGSRLLDQLFGSDEVSRRVAQQAAAFSGVGADILQQMLPLLAGMMAGGLTRMATAPGAMFANFGAPPAPQPSTASASAPWADMWSQWMGLARPAEPRGAAQAPANPFEAMMTSFLRAGFPQAQPAPKPEPEPEPTEATSSGSLGVWGQMMETGQEMQRQYLASLQGIFDGARSRGPERP
jgi:hypothetical protein